MDYEMSEYKLNGRDDTKPFEVREKYYNEFHPNLKRILKATTQQFTYEFCKEYPNNIDRLYENEFKEIEERNLKFAKLAEEKLADLRSHLSSQELENLVKAQKKAVEDASNLIFPF